MVRRIVDRDIGRDVRDPKNSFKPCCNQSLEMRPSGNKYLRG